MMLLIDVGNSRLKWSLYLDGFRADTHRIEYRSQPLSLIFEEQWAELVPPKRVIVSNVAGQSFVLALAAWVKEAWGLSLEIVQVEPDAFNVQIAYSNPGRFGVDRWISLVAARKLIQGAVCIVDCGTAITMDVMDAGGKHLGGLIVPGISLMRKSLSENTQGIGAVPNAAEFPLLAQDTVSAVQAGSLWAAVGFIDRMMEELRRELSDSITMVITGGDTDSLLPRLAGSFRHEPDWIMKGLVIVAEGIA